jgi:ACS family glucarate transporter-like MFS transporter
LADRYGPRKVLITAISWCSGLTAGTAIAPRLPIVKWFGIAGSIAIIRFLIGIGEAPSSPSYTKVSQIGGGPVSGVSEAALICLASVSAER